MNRRDFARLAACAALAPVCAPLYAQANGTTGVRFSVMLWALEKTAPFDRCLEVVSQAGYQGIELVGEFQRWSPAERARITARIRSLGLVVDAMSGVKAGFAVPDDSAAFRAQFADHLRSARELECQKLILLSGRRIDGLKAGTQRETTIDNLRWAAEQAAKDKMEILIEPIDLLENPSIYLSTVTDGFDLARAVGAPNLKVLYDFYHEQRSYGNLIEKLQRNIDLVGLVHVADVPGRHEPGTGEIDYRAVYRNLAMAGYKQWIAMEYYPTTDPVASLKEARVQAQKAMQG